MKTFGELAIGLATVPPSNKKGEAAPTERKAEIVSTRTLLVISPNHRLIADLAPLLSQHLPLTPIVEWNQYPDLRTLPDSVSGRAPSTCFIDVSSEREIALRVVTLLASVSPTTQIVALLTKNDPDLILTCLRQGAAEFLIQPLSSEQLMPVLGRLTQLQGPDKNRGGGSRVYAVVPAKGACGASTIATNLAFQWKRIGAKRLLLADLDASTGIISFLLKLKFGYSFVDALARAGTLDSDLWRGLVTNVNGVDVLLSPENGIELAGNLPNPAPVIDFCREAYEIVTLDVGEPFSRWSLDLMASSDQVLLVSTNELPALRAVQRVLQHLERNGIERSRVRLIVNRYSTEVGLTEEAIETALHIDVAHILPSDYDAIQRALVEGKPVAPQSSFSKSLQSLADKLAGKQVETEVKAQKKSNSWTALFHSLLSRSTS